MSYEFHLREGRWSARRLRAFVEAWKPPVPIFTQMPWTRSRKGPATWFFGEGSVRGCTLQLDADLLKARSLRVRLNLMASRADWQLGQSLVRELLAAGGGEAYGPGDQVIASDALQEPAAGADALAQLRTDAAELAGSLKSDRTYAALPNPAFSLIVTKELLPAETDQTNFALALEEELALMAARYQRSEPVERVQLPDGSSFSIFPDVDALAYASQFYAVPVANGDGLEQYVLPGPRFFELMGERLEVVSEKQDRFYFPALDFQNTDDAKVLTTITKEGQPFEAWLTRFPEF